ncbi:MAG: FAD-binding oxidoreductase [Actinobacteria bacterium]|nr:FAD-binding oxidoreductase [Actinomycetota bacterium]
MNSVSPLVPSADEELLTGWGRTSPSRARVARPVDITDITVALDRRSPRGVLARGLGRSYGDAAQSGGATVIDMTGVKGFSLDPATATVRADGGASLDAILRAIVPRGFFVPVTPGTRMVTVGGAIAADIHGKNHHGSGSFGAHVRALDLLTGDGRLLTLTPETTPEEFWATVGGMGLTGIIVSATFDVIPIETSLISVDTERGTDLDDVMARMLARDSDYRYTVAWIDSVAASGRGVITRGDHARADQLPAGKRASMRDYDPAVRITAPSLIPSGLLNTLTVRAFNEAWFRKHPRQRADEVQSIAAFFHPLDGVQEWNRVYGPRGFLQYQFVVPDSGAEVVRTSLEKLARVGAPSFLTVLKRFGPSNPAPLSFPMPGWTLAADVPARVEGLDRVLDELDELVAQAGGRLYFAKDSRQSPEMVRRTYPRLTEWQAVRNRMDPDRVFTSDLARRLEL